MCSIKFFEVYKGKYIGDVFGCDDKGPLIRKWIMGGDIKTVEEFFKITKIKFKDII